MWSEEAIDLGMELYNYEIGCIVNDNRYIIGVTDDIYAATRLYEKAVAAQRNVKDHVIIFLYDYNKNANINYFDSEVD